MTLYGYHPPSITSPLKWNTKVQAVVEHIENQQEVLKLLKDNLVMEQNKMKQQEYQHCGERKFEVVDWIFLRIQPYKQMSLKKKHKDNKLSHKYYGPYKVLQSIGSMAYEMEFLAYSCVHRVFHVSFLKRVIDNKITVQTILPDINEEGKIILDLETILETRIKKLRNQAITYYLVKWKNLLVEEVTWEDNLFM
jgi:hypothetical protein